MRLGNICFIFMLFAFMHLLEWDAEIKYEIPRGRKLSSYYCSHFKIVIGILGFTLIWALVWIHKEQSYF